MTSTGISSLLLTVTCMVTPSPSASLDLTSTSQPPLYTPEDQKQQDTLSLWPFALRLGIKPKLLIPSALEAKTEGNNRHPDSAWVAGGPGRFTWTKTRKGIAKAHFQLAKAILPVYFVLQILPWRQNPLSQLPGAAQKHKPEPQSPNKCDTTGHFRMRLFQELENKTVLETYFWQGI